MSTLANEPSSHPMTAQSSSTEGVLPLTVVCSFLSRADNTPLEQRPRAAGHMFNRHGSLMADPALDAYDNAFEPEPNLNFEHWGEYWRKVHGARFLHLDNPDDKGLDRLLRYDQLHRFGPGPTNTDAPPYRAPVDERGELWPTIIGHVEPYRRPRWDGIAYLNFADVADVAGVLGSARFQEKILPEDRVMFRDIAPVLARQYVIVPSVLGNDPIILVKMHVRNQQVSRGAFQQWWLKEHSAVVLREAGSCIRRYVQLHNVGPDAPGQPLYHPYAKNIDGITLMAFGSVTDLEKFLGSPSAKIIAKDEARMCDPAATEWWTTISMTVVNRIKGERATTF